MYTFYGYVLYEYIFVLALIAVGVVLIDLVIK